ncbi:MAG: (Fe-S)-binding protein [Desulfovibrio sp.]|nr:(Fe-S)-binding protein [Desulfovibrio sp.]
MSSPTIDPKMAELLQLVKNEADKCIRCGECRTVCPVFEDTPAERYTARGKIAIAESLARGELEFNDHVREVFDNCLLCTGCASQCSSGARADKVVIATRAVFADKLGVPALKRLIGALLSQPGKVLDAEARIGALLQPLACKAVSGTSGLYRRFAMPLADKDQYLPKIASKPFRSQVCFAGDSSWPKVLFFTGCMVNHCMPEIGHSVVKVLNALGVAVEVPRDQGCCAMPMLTSGERDLVRKQAERNVRAFCLDDQETPIVIACASGGHMLKHGYLDLFGDDPVLGPKLRNMAERTMDVTEYICSCAKPGKLAQLASRATGIAATYHDPCHLRKAQKITEQPRAVLKAATATEVHEMEHPEACCGLGGTYCLANMERSKRIQAKKITDAAATRVETIATACPACILQLRDGLRRANAGNVSVKHVIQILAEAMP